MNSVPRVLSGYYTQRVCRPSFQQSFRNANNLLHRSFKRFYIPLQVRGPHYGVKRLTKEGTKKIIYGGTFRPIGLLDHPPFTLFWTWITLMIMMHFFGAQHPEEYYLSLSRYTVYLTFGCLHCFAWGFYF